MAQKLQKKGAPKKKLGKGAKKLENTRTLWAINP